MKNAPSLDFPQFAPDLTAIGTNVSGLISGAIPQADGYGPFKSLIEFTQALPSACRGFFFARQSDGSIAVFAGTATNLYLLDNTTFAWTLVSKGGLPYGSLVTEDNWQFAQFNNLVLAVQNNTVPQKFILNSSVQFVDLGGSPPQASHVAIVNRFIVLTGLLSNENRVQWSDLDAPETWTAGVGLADFQDLPDGGRVHVCAGGDAYGVIFQDESIRRLIYAPGSAVTFQITRISVVDALYSQYSVVAAGPRTFFLSAQGFKMIEETGAPKSIGKERVDRTFFKDVDTSNLQLIQAATDPTGTRVYWAYKSQQGAAGLFDKILVYDWSIGDTGRWSILPVSGQYLAALARPGLTLEQLDDLAPGIVYVTNATNNGAGKVRLTFNELSNQYYGIPGHNFIRIRDIVGTVEANGTWNFVVSGPNTIDLPTVNFVNAYVSGGKSGGSLDALPFSLDSISISAVSSLAAFSPNNKVGFFTGPNLEAILETSDQDLDGQLVFIDTVCPMTDSPQALVSIGKRRTAQQAISYSTEKALNTFTGVCPAGVETRYARGRLRIPAESVWTFATGLQPDVQPAGDT